MNIESRAVTPRIVAAQGLPFSGQPALRVSSRGAPAARRISLRTSATPGVVHLSPSSLWIGLPLNNGPGGSGMPLANDWSFNERPCLVR
ncbi:hypothetical protein [Pseudomonas sp. ML96]|uniref:hypothetical protein n=1 Tax=Pseudomonas sp. ML96 TaxID=1523503 RepID=UPI0005B91777|nr:hypothetical protein [Pseudomonas sp. ML96]